MKVTLINHTQNAVNLLLFTKMTRLEMSVDALEHIDSYSAEEKAAELAYMARTIRSSWEFVDYTFLIQGVSRACAQQITRTRTASFAMQSMRVADASEFAIINPFPEDEHAHAIFDDAAKDSRRAYSLLTRSFNASKEDARGIMPLNTACNLVAKYNLRTFVDLIAQRTSLRAQGEYSAVADEMKRLVLEVHPEFDVFFEHPLDGAIKLLEGAAKRLGITAGQGESWDIAKAIDLIRKHA